MNVVGKFKFIPALFIFSLCFLIVLLAGTFASRQFATIWLPLALTAAVAALMSLAKPSLSRPVAWFAIICGVIFMWMISEPETSIGAHPRLAPIALGFCIVGVVLLVVQLAKWVSSQESVFGWAVGLVLLSWLIAFFSSPSGGSGGMLSAAINLLGLSSGQAEIAVLVLRKCIHFTFYGLLGFTAYRWALATGTDTRSGVWFGLMMALAYAAFDEGRQTFYPDRTGSVWDVLLDCAGAGAFVLLAFRKRSTATHSQLMPE